MKIFIHTYGRIDRQITLQSLSKKLLKDTYIVVQHREHMEWMSIPVPCTLLVLPKHIQTLSPTRHYILEWAVKQKMEKICMMDDDLKFFNRKSDDDHHLIPSTKKIVQQMFADIEKGLDTHTHVGISFREYNNTHKTRTGEGKPITRLLAYKPKEVLELGCRFDRMMLRQDLDMTLQLIRKGRLSLVFYCYASSQTSNLPGGVSTYRKAELVEQQIQLFAKLHYPFVTFGRPKKSRGVVGKDELPAWKTVIVAWKKAYNSSRKNPMLGK